MIHLSLELLLPQVEAFAEGSASAAAQLRAAIKRGEDIRRDREPPRDGKPGRDRKADDPQDRIGAQSDKFLVDALTAETPTEVQLQVRRRARGTEGKVSLTEARRIVASIPTVAYTRTGTKEITRDRNTVDRAIKRLRK